MINYSISKRLVKGKGTNIMLSEHYPITLSGDEVLSERDLLTKHEAGLFMNLHTPQRRGDMTNSKCSTCQLSITSS